MNNSRKTKTDLEQDVTDIVYKTASVIRGLFWVALIVIVAGCFILGNARSFM